MWELKNHTPFPAETGFYRSHDTRGYWGLWISADFQLREGKPPLFLSKQAPLAASPEFRDDEALARDGEKTPARAAIDLIIAGQATQPTAHEERPKRVGVRLGAWHKELHLYQPLSWGPMGRPRPDDEAAPRRVAVDGSASFGGAEHPQNPLGHGHGTRAQAEAKRPAALYPAGAQPPVSGEAGKVGAFGPVSPLWPGRAALAGTYDDAWQARRAPLLPTDFDPAFWQAAPEDQRLPRLMPDDLALEVYGFDGTGTVERPTRFALPSLAFRCDTRIGAGWQNAAAELQSITVDFDTLTLRMHYHAAWALRRADDDVEITRTVLTVGETNSFRVRSRDAHLFHASVSAMPERSVP